MNDLIYLISQTYAISASGDAIAAETKRMVFVERKSIGLKRKLEADEAGLKLAYKFVMTDEADYNGEEILEYNGQRYNIVNVFINDLNQVELTTAVH